MAGRYVQVLTKSRLSALVRSSSRAPQTVRSYSHVGWPNITLLFLFCAHSMADSVRRYDWTHGDNHQPSPSTTLYDPAYKTAAKPSQQHFSHSTTKSKKHNYERPISLLFLYFLCISLSVVAHSLSNTSITHTKTSCLSHATLSLAWPVLQASRLSHSRTQPRVLHRRWRPPTAARALGLDGLLDDLRELPLL